MEPDDRCVGIDGELGEVYVAHIKVHIQVIKRECLIQQTPRLEFSDVVQQRCYEVIGQIRKELLAKHHLQCLVGVHGEDLCEAAACEHHHRQ